MLRGLRNLIAFLTAIPVGMTEEYLVDAARYMSLFPLVGALIGLMAGALGWLIYSVFGHLIVGTLTLAFIILVTGAHHADGLLDFGDGLMCLGSPNRKIEAMRDPHIGTGGLTLGLTVFLTSIFSISQLSKDLIVQSLVTSEASAKLAMVFMAWIGREAHEGMSKHFIDAMHGEHRYTRLLIALLITCGIALPLLRMAGAAAVIASLLTSLAIVGISNRHFKGLTGNSFGAGNELARLSSLIAILVTSR